MFLTDPARWQRLAMAVGAVPLLFAGGAFLAPGLWELSLGRWCWLCFWFGTPIFALGTVLGAAALLPRGTAREAAVDGSCAAFLISFTLALLVPIVQLLRGRP